MKLISLIRSGLSLIYNFFYWTVYNFRFNSRIYNYKLSRSIRPGKHVMVRKGAEIGINVSIGDYSYISGPINYIESAHIGKFCSIARQTVIGVGDHNYNWVTTHPIIVSKNYGFIEHTNLAPQKAPPIIGNDVWIGINSVISRGVTIGDGAVIAAGAIVTKNVEPYSIVGGTPAKHIKYRFSESIIKDLLEIRWWEWEEEKIKNELKYMYDIKLFVKRNINV
jgi:acetyltransferase-like isoleucine patch superfamily enzyme